ncbi:DctP family TRAP transporter solute-binding subunit [Simplicispira suum]|uniref:DctP family TRAP transporter solute-binding subunit n=1 Tax=Simplicispira suum TaxID=2109915 RepID=UPI0011B29BD1|nr:DctP family TRAP transporter solute-binding subunit [Simplicispira suum]MBW7833507.1 DctP family TRAP transporter solute-binding subunit [Simplicispira suum]
MPSRIAHALSRRHALLAGAALGLAAGSRGLRAASGAFTIRFAHVVAEDTPKGLAARRFQALVQERSGGRITVTIYPEAQLYGDHDEVQALQLGAVEILAPSLSKFGRIGFPEFELFDLPYFFPDVAGVRRITQGALGQRMLARLERQRLVGLGFMDNGFKHMSANRPLLEVADFAGQRMRIQASRVIAAQMRALGAQPVTLAFSETRRALAAGVVDGTENPISNFWTQGMQEVQTDLSLTEHGYLGYAVVTSQRFWLALSASDRALVRDAMGQALAFGNQIADTQNEKALAALRTYAGTRIHPLTPAQKGRLRAAVQSVHTGLAQRIGADWLEEARAALERMP